MERKDGLGSKEHLRRPREGVSGRGRRGGDGRMMMVVPAANLMALAPAAGDGWQETVHSAVGRLDTACWRFGTGKKESNTRGRVVTEGY